jgi:2-polyprenyl-3-methyl-5-hydroxy-6-metoxy-1,4-benzoquinol methylase
MIEPEYRRKFAKRKCAVCDSTDSSLLFRQNFLQLSSGSLLAGYDVVVCNICGFGFADHIPMQTEFDTYYQKMSKYEYQNTAGQVSEFDRMRFEAVVDTVIPFFTDRQVRLLDIGCSTGHLLALFKERGYHNVVGLDPSPVCAETARMLFNIPVWIGSLSDTPRLIGDGPLFDSLLLSGVLEHIRDLGPILTQMRKMLKPHGLIYIEVPDATAFSHWPDAPFQQFSNEHINFFSAISLTNLMQRYGFVPLFSQQTARNQSYSTMMPVVASIYSMKAKPHQPLPVPDHETENGLDAYIRQSKQVDEVIRQRIDELVDQSVPLVVWGVGTHTVRLFATSPLRQANIRAFVDSNVRYQGKQLDGIPIISPNDLKGRAESILISSRVFQKEIKEVICRELKVENEIITLYCDAE